MYYKRILILTSILLMSINIYQVFGQKTEIYEAYNKNFIKGMHLFEQEKYSSALRFFDKTISDLNTENSTIRTNAQYYHAICAVRLFNNDAEYLIYKFIEQHPESPLINEAYFEMGRFRYRNDQFEPAIEWLLKIDTYRLSKKELTEYYFMLGYSYFKVKDYAQSRVALFQIKDTPSDYSSPALYYYSHIAYEEDNIQTALNGFQNLQNDETFAPIVPYYIAQILFKQEKYKEIIAYAPPLFDEITEKRKAEFARIIGDAYYMNKQYDSSLVYYDIYMQDSAKMRPIDHYRVGFAYYKTEMMDKAIAQFEPLANDSSALSQNVLYLLGDCYLKTNEKKKAGLAFASASNYNFDTIIQRDALFNYGMVMFELSYSPFNEAIDAFNKYIELYPYSEKNDIAFKFLVMSYMNTRNYKGALESIDKIKVKKEIIFEALQRIAYFRGLELFNNLQFNDALSMFVTSLKHDKYDHLIKANTLYWKGETHFRLGEFDKAIENYTSFTLQPGVYEGELFNDAHYALAYSYFEMKKYNEAGQWFRKFTQLNTSKNDKKIGDAYNRTGDCYFVLSDYWRAIEYYDKAIDYNISDVDYALFQKGFSLGLLAQYDKKIETLNTILYKHNQSNYADDALFEIANAYVDLSQKDQAIKYYQKIISEYPNSSYESKALTQMGLMYYNLDQNDKALQYYKTVVEKYSGTSEEKDALVGIKNIFMSENTPEEYFNFLKTKNLTVEISSNERDSMIYAAAQNVYMNNNCDKAIKMFTDYLAEFPIGDFYIHANYYLGDCQMRSGNEANALQYFGNILSKGRNIFTENALKNTARIQYKANNYNVAIEQYLKLIEIAEIKSNKDEAQVELMRCYYQIKNYPKTIEMAEQIILIEKIDEETVREAHFKIAKSYLETKQIEKAIGQFTITSKEAKSLEGAESKYMTAFLYNQINNPTEAKQNIFELLEMSTPHQYWLAKSFILLADIYIVEKDNFQAIHTLKSIVENYEDKQDGVLKEAQEKLTKLQESEKQ